MMLIGMFDSPFVRRVAVSMTLLDIPFEHRNWSVGKDFEAIRRYNPLGRVPTLVLDDGESLMESSAILDYVDELVGAGRALLPPAGAERRAALRLMSIASGAAEKGVLQVYEKAFRPEDKRHPPWVERCATQMHAGLAELERAAVQATEGWLVGSHITQADITATCVFSFVSQALGADRGVPSKYPRLGAQSRRCEAMPAFQAAKLDFDPPSA
jgi:glutathione S-transferase